MDYNSIDVKEVGVSSTKSHTTESGAVNVSERQPKKALVANSSVEEVKPGLITRLVKGLLGPNGVKAIFTYLGKEVVAPAIKDTVVNSITTGVNMMAYGEDRTRYNNTNGGWVNPMRGNVTYTNYSSAYHQTNSTTNMASPANPGRVKDIFFYTHQDAQVVLDNLCNDINTYGYARLADYYDYAGQPSVNYMDNAFGWRYLGGIRIINTRGKYMIGFPPVVAL